MDFRKVQKVRREVGRLKRRIFQQKPNVLGRGNVWVPALSQHLGWDMLAIWRFWALEMHHRAESGR